jgi:hypothetical protein
LEGTNIRSAETAAGYADTRKPEKILAGEIENWRYWLEMGTKQVYVVFVA